MTEEAAPGAIFRIVHLEGGAAQFKEIMAGNIDVAFDNVGSIVRAYKSGEVRALAVMDDVRSKFLPDVPTTKELGFPTVISSSTRGIAGPKGMPAPIVTKLREVLKKAMDRPRARQEARGPGHRHQDHGRRRVRTSTSPTRTPRPRSTPSGPRTARRSSGPGVRRADWRRRPSPPRLIGQSEEC